MGSWTAEGSLLDPSILRKHFRTVKTKNKEYLRSNVTADNISNCNWCAGEAAGDRRQAAGLRLRDRRLLWIQHHLLHKVTNSKISLNHFVFTIAIVEWSEAFLILSTGSTRTSWRTMSPTSTRMSSRATPSPLSKWALKLENYIQTKFK